MTHLLHQAWIRLAGLIPGEIHQSELIWLLAPGSHFPLLARRRAGMIVNRVRLFALCFAILTPLWSIIDYLAFPAALWLPLAILRLVATLAFISLVTLTQPSGNLAKAYRIMAAFFTIPTLFFIASYHILLSFQLTGLSAAIASGYAFLPFILIAGLSIFPLTIVENLVIACPILVALAVTHLLELATLDWAPFAGALWLLALIAGVSTLAGISQLTFMIAIVQQAIRDPLTGVYSRRSGMEAMELHFSVAQRTGTPLSVCFLDLDHFKSINDRYGHDAGDRTLIAMAAWLSSELRLGDFLSRWGGEEFVIIMPNTDLARAQQAIARIRAHGLGMQPDDKTPITASIGIAEYREDHIENWKALLDRADQRMYRAKALGRDRVIVSDEGDIPETQH